MGSHSEGHGSPQTQAAAQHFGRMALSSVLKMAFSPFIADHISRLSRYFSVLPFSKPESPEGIKCSPEQWTVRYSEALFRNAFWMKLSALLGGALLSSHFIPSHLLLLPQLGWRSRGPGQAGRCLSVLGAAGSDGCCMAGDPLAGLWFSLPYPSDPGLWGEPVLPLLPAQLLLDTTQYHSLPGCHSSDLQGCFWPGYICLLLF